MVIFLTEEYLTGPSVLCVSTVAMTEVHYGCMTSADNDPKGKLYLIVERYVKKLVAVAVHNWFN